MDAITALLSRASASRLLAPAPGGQQREQIFAAALRAPDHGRIRPWRFLVVEGAARDELGAAMERAMRRHDPALDQAAAAKLRANPLRAPLLIVLVVRLCNHPKVPHGEQLLSGACAAGNMMLAAHALGFGAMWRTGAVTYLPELRDELGLAEAEQVIGFLYIGTPETPVLRSESPAIVDHFENWPANPEQEHEPAGV